MWLTRAVGVCAVALLALMMTATSASAAPADGLEFSMDGTSWSAEPPASLYDTGIRWVPGDSRSATVHVRNTHGTPVQLVAVLDGFAWTSPDAAAAFLVSGSDGRPGSLAPTTVHAVARCTQVVAPRMLSADEEYAFTVTVGLDPAITGMTAQDEGIGFRVLLALAEAGGPAPTPACSTPRTPGQKVVVIPSEPETPTVTPSAPLLPRTSSDRLGVTGVGAELIPTAAVALTAGLVGLLFIALARRRSRDASEAGADVVDEPTRDGREVGHRG